MQQSPQDVKLGRFLSLVLRHNPQAIGITLDAKGWADVEALLAGMNRKGKRIDFATLERLVRENNKQRYSFNEDKTKIRANQGHSLYVDVELQQAIPPDTLYHGTGATSVDTILKQGIQKQSRQHVHLSKDKETAIAVGKRHGNPVVLTIDAAKMVEDGFLFYLSENKVWLCDYVPAVYIKK